MSASIRYLPVDTLRGLIMAIMAHDHSSALIACQHASEFWAGAMSSYTSAFAFLTRWITHLCAPGFFLLMGDGIYWHCAARSDSGVSQHDSVHRTVWRGFALFLMAQFLQTPILLLLAMLKPAALSLNRVPAPPPDD